MSNNYQVAAFNNPWAVMNQRLPEYDRPPLIEVALGVQFEPVIGLTIPHMGELWSHYKEQFPHVEHRDPLDPVIERKGVRLRSPNPGLMMLGKLPLPRVWFIDESSRELVQIQQDRFVRNWRKSKSEDIYPRYENEIRSTFERDYGKFADFITSRNLGKLEANQCEVTYVNHIPVEKEWAGHEALRHLTSFWSDSKAATESLTEEDARIQLRYEISDPQEGFIGRLHVTFEPGFVKDKNLPVYVLRLTARGKPLGEGLTGILNFLDLGRLQIVRTFTNLTSKEMHQKWERKNV